MMYANFFIRKILREECRERDSNPHSHYWPRDFKSLVSTNSTIAAAFAFENYIKRCCVSGKRDSNPRPQPWQGCALPTELFPLVQLQEVKRRRLELPRHNCHYPLKVARLPIPPPLHYLEIPYLIQNDMLSKMFERKTGLGPATPTLARLCSTN